MSENNHKAIIFGIAGRELSRAEAAFFHASRPIGIILFERNIESRAQLQALTDDLRAQSGNPHLPILIDQEGGRVARLKPPLVRAYPPMAAYGALYKQDAEKARRAARLGAALLASDLYELGININCAPCLDLGLPQTAQVIGDRAFAPHPDWVAQLGRSFMDGLAQGGVLPVLKHLPGHGRATVDSHATLPIIDAPVPQLQAQDFAPFRQLNDALLGMTGHLLFSHIDADLPSTLSPIIIGEIIRGHIGFDGLLMSDDISMQALPQPITTSAQQALAAGCDIILHCNGNMAEMQALAEVVPEMGPRARQQMQKVNHALANLSCNIEDNAAQIWAELVRDIFPLLSAGQNRL